MGQLLAGELMEKTRPSSPVTELRPFSEDKEIGEVWIAVTWGG